MRQPKIPINYVLCYRNLHKQLFSVVSANTKKVMGHVPLVLLHDVTFRVSEKGRQRVIKEKRKNVHSKVVGKISYDFGQEALVASCGIEVTYNPYLFDSFVTVGEKKSLQSAEWVLLYNGKQIKVLNPIFKGELNDF